MESRDYFVNKPKRLRNVVKWYKETCKDYHKDRDLRQFYYYGRNGNDRKAFNILLNLTQDLIDMYYRNGNVTIGYVLDKNIDHFGRIRVIKALMRGLLTRNVDLRHGTYEHGKTQKKVTDLNYKTYTEMHKRKRKK